ncbi:MAG: hypothetical protein R3Y63_04560 [Eubacteriales bacterium]
MANTTWLDDIEFSVYQSLNRFMDVVLESMGEQLECETQKRICSVFQTNFRSVDRWCNGYYKFNKCFEKELEIHRQKHLVEHPKGYSITLDNRLIRKIEGFPYGEKKNSRSGTLAQIQYEIKSDGMVDSGTLRHCKKLLLHYNDSVIKFVIAHEFGHIVSATGETAGESIKHGKVYFSNEAKADAIAVLLTAIAAQEYIEILPKIRGKTYKNLDTLADMTLMALRLLGVTFLE